MKVDGRIGSKTIRAANKFSGKKLVQEIRAEAAQYYARLVLRKPVMKVFLRGWMRRAVS